MREAAIVSTARTAIAKAYRGALNNTEAPPLGAHVVNAAIERAGIDPGRVDDLFMGAGSEWGTQSYNLGRMTVLASKLPQSVAAFTLDRKCASGLTALALAASPTLQPHKVLCELESTTSGASMRPCGSTAMPSWARWIR